MPTTTEKATRFVYDMAESDPYIEITVTIDGKGFIEDPISLCRYCRAIEEGGTHKPLCPWRRATRIALDMKMEGIPL